MNIELRSGVAVLVDGVGCRPATAGEIYFYEKCAWQAEIISQFKAAVEHSFWRGDFTPNGSQEGWFKRILADLEKGPQ